MDTTHGVGPRWNLPPGWSRFLPVRIFRRDASDDRDQAFAAYYEARGPSVRVAAYLLCGDWHLAEDLAQTAFIKLYRAWRRVGRYDGLDQYVRRVLLRAFLDERRRPWRREFAAGDRAAAFDQPVTGPDMAGRLAMWAALGTLSPRQRAVLVLRFWEDLPVEQVADLLDMPIGSVKSATSRGLRAMREAVDVDDAMRSVR
jgi:RNA polymerase sigma-70 factor (sigma-E family)